VLQELFPVSITLLAFGAEGWRLEIRRSFQRIAEQRNFYSPSYWFGEFTTMYWEYLLIPRTIQEYLRGFSGAPAFSQWALQSLTLFSVASVFFSTPRSPTYAISQKCQHKSHRDEYGPVIMHPVAHILLNGEHNHFHIFAFRKATTRDAACPDPLSARRAEIVTHWKFRY